MTATGPASAERVRPSSARARTPVRGAGLGWVATMALVAVLLQVAVMPYVNIADGIPDLVAPTVVAVALLRGTYDPASWAFAGDHRLGILAVGAYFVVGLALLAGIDVERGRRAALS